MPERCHQRTYRRPTDLNRASTILSRFCAAIRLPGSAPRNVHDLRSPSHVSQSAFRKRPLGSTGAWPRRTTERLGGSAQPDHAERGADSADRSCREQRGHEDFLTQFGVLRAIPADLAPYMPSIISRVRSGYAPHRGGLQTGLG